MTLTDDSRRIPLNILIPVTVLPQATGLNQWQGKIMNKLEVTNPFDHSHVGEVPVTGWDEVDGMLEHA